MKRQTAFDAGADLTDRLRAALSAQPAREVRMFGALCFMVNDKLLIGTTKDGALLVRIDPDRSADLMTKPGTAIPEMGTGRSMGPGWMRVAPEAADVDLDFWLAEAMDFNPRAKKSR